MPLAPVFGAMMRTVDGVRIDAGHIPGDSLELCIVVAHGFTGTWRERASRRIAHVLNGYGGVLAFDFRGHGRSSGLSTVGDKEIHDIEAVVRHARVVGYRRVVTVGFSMGAAVAIRHAGLIGGVDGVVAVSGPARWYYRDTRPMRQVHWAIERPIGRLAARLVKRTRIATGPWDPVPVPPYEAVRHIAPTPLLIVHGDADAFFPVEHAHQLYENAREPRELWIEPGYGHAETAATPALVRRIGEWAAKSAKKSLEPRTSPRDLSST
ncbi:alpha/beta hydrolase [Thermopolyspora flexuosa]|jgi:pimeloyl-ACP methyl ester carboxylesterase|nr:alpha/beta fold hydrolase [Thermopolyspora flexuosa]